MGALPDDWTLPVLDSRTRTWFTSGHLAVQECAECRVLQHPPEEICHRCGAMSFTHRTVAARGTVYSHTVVHYPVHPALARSVPYTVVLVALDEAPEVRVIGNLVDMGEPGNVCYIGMPVEAIWEEHQVDGEVVRLPQWKAVNTSGSDGEE